MNTVLGVIGSISLVLIMLFIPAFVGWYVGKSDEELNNTTDTFACVFILALVVEVILLLSYVIGTFIG
jgi:hypothetical protein